MINIHWAYMAIAMIHKVSPNRINKLGKYYFF